MRRNARWLALLAPLVFLTGCGLLGSGSATSSSAGGSSASDATNPGQPFQIYAQGSPTATPTTSSGVPPYPFPTATGFLPITGGTTRATPTATCGPDMVHFSSIKGLTVVPGTTSAVVTWYNVGGYNLKQYRVTAISQDLKRGEQRDVGFTEVTPAAPCGQLSVSVPKLDRATNYVFSVDAVVYRHSGDGTYAGTIYRSGVVRTK